ncbi:glycoside hydrolase family 5 protein [Pisolithus orientalis]|uniref:glycoside hydrolase family 5 protein n=1 Tax=Pisolithus orientalis TaxID=936130 RepID=UPI002223FD5D|nr:glycoside hydrolase family 5 protein [Pisolithus orientalis]KAI6015142.1 glycoside hydrolase family 5 protein [Pisolithus orientalis]
MESMESSSETSFELLDDVDDSPQAPLHPSHSPNYTPGSGSTYAHDWSPSGTGGKLRIHGRHFVDAFGRVCNLRGVNVAGSSKTPVNHNHEAFPHDHHAVTFVGRPFPLVDAPQHFARLRRWGLSLIRFVITWEAVEHAGPGIYDMDYLAYVRDLLSLLPQYGLVALIDIHQDVWSRYSGGSGAPAWTLESIGFDLHALEESGAAWLLGVKGGGHVEAERGIWPCGYQKLAAATMATKPVQQFLQEAFLDMYTVVVKALGDIEGVLGFEIMNEPHRGYIDLPSLYQFNYNTDLHLSYVPSAVQSFMLGAGYPTLVSNWTRSFPMPTRKTSHSVLNAASRKAWRVDGPTEGRCVWELHGVWGWDKIRNEGVVLRENYFVKDPMTGRKVNWYTDFYYPFLKRWAKRVRDVIPKDKMLFVEPIPNEFCPSSWTKENQVPNMVFAPHWYDLDTLFSKKFGDFSVNVQGLSRGMFPLQAFYWGQLGVRENYSRQIRNIVDSARKVLGEVPVLIGECGIPMDMNAKEAFETENWKWQYRMMDALMVALEGSLANFALWNYNPHNSDVEGDDWNGENFSPHLHWITAAGILSAIVRPYPAKTAGIPLQFSYEMNTGQFTFEWKPSDTIPLEQAGQTKVIPVARETEIFVPSLLTHGRKLKVEGLEPEDTYVHDESRQTLFIVHGTSTPSKVRKVTVLVWPPLRPTFQLNTFWGDFGELIISGLVVFVGVFIFVKLKFFM